MRVPADFRKIGPHSGGRSDSPNDFLRPRRYQIAVEPLDLLGAGWVGNPSIDCDNIFGSSRPEHRLC
jgi:hypothetical protein